MVVAGQQSVTDAPRPWRQAVLWLLLLGPLFFTSYGFANWVASRRLAVGSLVFAWEQHIPFLPWTIVPYWSIDLLYGLSLFLCATRAELYTHVRRLLAVQLIAVSCFLVWPLRFSFERPDTGGVFGWLFDVLMGFDKPFNQVPSLHISLLVLLWVLYARYTAGVWRWLLHGWFSLIGLSVLTTYQHHFIDLPTGLWLGWLGLWLFPDQGPGPLAAAALTRDPARCRLAGYYAVGGLLLVGLALWGGGWALWLLWPAAALLLVALIYAWLGESAFQKHPDGRLSAATIGLLGPYVLGAWLNSRWWTRALAYSDPVMPGLLLGRLPTARERAAQGVRAIVDVTAELPCPSAGIRYANVPLLDLVSPSLAQLEQAVLAIEAARATGPVLVCCALGCSRSALAVAAWLWYRGHAEDIAVAIAQVRQARPAVVLGPRHQVLLERFARRGRA